MSSTYQLFKGARGKRGSGDRIELIETGGLTSSAENGLSSPAPALQEPVRSSALSGTRTTGRNGPGGRLLRGGKNQKGFMRLGLPKGALKIYIDDLYHTLLNMPRYRFLMSFFSVYIILYLAFAFLYWGVRAECIISPDVIQEYDKMTFGFAFWFSVQTASTIGYSSYLVPDPICGGVNFLVTFQIICAALIDTMLMSLVFARFAAPMPRASTIRFSQQAVLYRRDGGNGSVHGAGAAASRGCWVLSFRLANIRRHNLLDPEITLLLAIPDRLSSAVGVQSAYRFVSLHIEDPLTQVTSLKLGLPAAICHVITPTSPLWDLSVAEMEMREMEFLCFMSGTDPMTSNMLQARHAYLPADIRMNERFAAVGLRTNARGKDGLDLSAFDDTCRADLGMGMGNMSRDESGAVLYPLPTSTTTTPGDVRTHMAQLRACTFSSLSAGPYSLEQWGSAVNGSSDDLRAFDPLAGAVALQDKSHRGGAQGMQAVGWEEDVTALCESVMMDTGASVVVQQQAGALLATLRTAPRMGQQQPQQQPQPTQPQQQPGTPLGGGGGPAAAAPFQPGMMGNGLHMGGAGAQIPLLPVGVASSGGHVVVGGPLQPQHSAGGNVVGVGMSQGGAGGAGHSRGSSGGMPALPQSVHHGELI